MRDSMAATGDNTILPLCGPSSPSSLQQTWVSSTSSQQRNSDRDLLADTCKRDPGRPSNTDAIASRPRNLSRPPNRNAFNDSYGDEWLVARERWFATQRDKMFRSRFCHSPTLKSSCSNDHSSEPSDSLRQCLAEALALIDEQSAQLEELREQVQTNERLPCTHATPPLTPDSNSPERTTAHLADMPKRRWSAPGGLPLGVVEFRMDEEDGVVVPQAVSNDTSLLCLQRSHEHTFVSICGQFAALDTYECDRIVANTSPDKTVYAEKPAAVKASKIRQITEVFGDKSSMCCFSDDSACVTLTVACSLCGSTHNQCSPCRLPLCSSDGCLAEESQIRQIQAHFIANEVGSQNQIDNFANELCLKPVLDVAKYYDFL